MRRHLGHIERQPGLRLRADLRRQLGARVERGSAPGAAPLGVESVRIDATYLRGSAAVAAAPAGSAGASLLKAAERDARALAKEPRPYARAFSRALSAAVALERGRLDRALRPPR